MGIEGSLARDLGCVERTGTLGRGKEEPYQPILGYLKYCLCFENYNNGMMVG